MGRAEKYGLEQWDVVGANRFNYLLSQLYRAGDAESELGCDRVCLFRCTF